MILICHNFTLMPLHICNNYYWWQNYNFYRATAMLSAVYAIVVCPSVCLCVCVSVTLRYCIKMAKRRITQITPHNSPVTSFLTPMFTAKFERDHPLRWRQMQVGWVEIRHFRRKTCYNSKVVQCRLGQTWYSLPCTKFESSSFSFSEIWMRLPKFKTCHVM